MLMKKKPWKNPDPKVIFDLVLILDNTAALLRPFLPATSEKITASINWVSKDALKIKKSEVLFPRFLV